MPAIHWEYIVFATTGNKVLGYFDVLAWGYGAYLDLHVQGPNGQLVAKYEEKSEARVEFTAQEDGEHSLCFKNAIKDTEVSFRINTESDSLLADVAKEGKCNLCQSCDVFFSACWNVAVIRILTTFNILCLLTCCIVNRAC